ncbi:MAG TPA: adenylyltransferase/cytidyltransferase family protein [Actinoplanes sp.]
MGRRRSPRRYPGLRDQAARAYRGTFDPFTPGHFDVADRARRLFDQVTVLVAVNDRKRPMQTILRGRGRSVPASRRTGTTSRWPPGTG